MLDKTTINDDKSNKHELAIDTLAGDIRDAMLQRIRDMKTPWTLMTEDKQTDTVNGLDWTARELVRGVVRLLTHYDFPQVVVSLGDVKIIGGDKKRIEGKIVASNIAEYRDILGEAVGDTVMMLMVDSETFMASRAPAKVDPDQPQLPGVDDETMDV